MDTDMRRRRPGLASRVTISRREFLQGIGVGAGLVGTGVASSALLRAAAAAAAPAEAVIKRGGTFITAKTTEAPSLDPQLTATLARQIRSSLIYNNLLSVDANLNVQPELAESYEVKGDNKQIVFKLRRGVKWHPPVNRELTADDVKFSYERLLKVSYARGQFANIQGIEAVDPHTVVFHLSQPDVGLVGNMASTWNGCIVNRETVERHGDLRRVAVGTGPFIVERWEPDSELRLRRNPDYFIKGRPYLDRVIMKVIPDESNIIAGLRANAIHHATLEENKHYDVLKNEKNLRAYRSRRLGTDMLHLNNSFPPFDRLPVRQAVSWAIDREEMIKVVAGGYAVLTAPITSAQKPWALPRHKWLHYYKPDLEKAKRLLAEAGLPGGFKSKLIIISGFPTMATAAQVIQANLRRIGVDLEIESLEYGVWAPRSLTKDPNQWFPLMLNTGPGWVDPDHWFYRWFHSKALNINNWNDPEVEKLVEEGRRTFDYQKRKAIYDQVQLIFLDRVPMIWLYSTDLIDITQGYVKGFSQHPTSYPLSYEQTWLDR